MSILQKLSSEKKKRKKIPTEKLSRSLIINYNLTEGYTNKKEHAYMHGISSKFYEEFYISKFYTVLSQFQVVCN